jgi:hypothetical protein
MRMGVFEHADHGKSRASPPKRDAASGAIALRGLRRAATLGGLFTPQKNPS